MCQVRGQVAARLRTALKRPVCSPRTLLLSQNCVPPTALVSAWPSLLNGL